MNQKTEFESAHALGASTEITVKNFNGIDHVMVPPGSSLKTLEELMPAPTRIKASPEFNCIKGFAEYVEEFKEEGTRIFVDDTNARFVTVFDCHAKDKPAWGDHSASIKMHTSSEWKRFCEFNEKHLSSKEFAEFLEDHIEYLSQSEGLSAGDLMTMAQKFKVNIKGDLEVEETLQAGMKTLIMKDDSTLSGQNVNGKQVSFPEMLCFDLRIFKNHHKYPLKVFLRYRASNAGIVFWIKITDPERLEEQAFDNVINDVKDITKLNVLKGKYSGYNHKQR